MTTKIAPGKLIATKVEQEVVDAILAGQTNVNRRCDIYQSDGSTLWMEGTNLKGGNVSVDSTRDERRNMDVILDNSDRTIVHDPEDGLWYDKVIKLYRGISYPNPRKTPRVLMLGINPATSPSVVYVLARAGLNDQTYVVDPLTTSIDTLLKYDIIVGWKANANLDANVSALLVAAYNMGKSILTNCNLATSATVPLISAVTVRAGVLAWDINQPTAYDTPMQNQWVNFNMTRNASETVITGLAANAIAVANTTVGTAGTAAAIMENGTGGKWFHLHPLGMLTYTPSVMVTRQLAFLKSAIGWLYTYADITFWETQIGEFLIDKISEPRRPREIRLVGRDYAKKLLLSKLDNATTVTAGGPLETVITALAANGGVTKVRSGLAGVPVATTLTFDRSTSRWEVIKSLCTAAGAEAFFDAWGYLVTRMFRDPLTSPITLKLATGEPSGNLIDFERSSDDSRLFNYISVIAEDPNSATGGILFSGIAQNTNPNSPTRISRIGRRSDYQSSSLFTSSAQCLAYAKKLLSVASLESYDLTWTSLVFPWLEASDIVEFDDPDTVWDGPDRYLLSSFQIPLGLEGMTGVCKRVTVVG